MPFSDESELDEQISQMDEEEFNKIFEQLQDLDIDNEEQAKKIVQDTLNHWFDKKYKKKFKPKPEHDTC